MIASASDDGWNATGAFLYASSRRRRAVNVRSSAVAPHTLSPQKKCETAVRCGVLPTGAIDRGVFALPTSRAAPRRRAGCARDRAASRGRDRRAETAGARRAANIVGLICSRPTPEALTSPRAAAALPVDQRRQHERIALRLARRPRARRARSRAGRRRARPRRTCVTTAASKRAASSAPATGGGSAGQPPGILELVDAALQRDGGRALAQAGDDVALGGGFRGGRGDLRAGGGVRVRDFGGDQDQGQRSELANIYVRVCHIGEGRQIFSDSAGAAPSHHSRRAGAFIHRVRERTTRTTTTRPSVSAATRTSASLRVASERSLLCAIAGKGM